MVIFCSKTKTFLQPLITGASHIYDKSSIADRPTDLGSVKRFILAALKNSNGDLSVFHKVFLQLFFL